jgi:hypothetical protein
MSPCVIMITIPEYLPWNLPVAARGSFDGLPPRPYCKVDLLTSAFGDMPDMTDKYHLISSIT